MATEMGARLGSRHLLLEAMPLRSRERPGPALGGQVMGLVAGDFSLQDSPRSRSLALRRREAYAPADQTVDGPDGDGRHGEREHERSAREKCGP